MRYIFNFPDIGEGLDEGTIVEWLVKKGQEVEMGDPLVTMETDKVVTDIPSPKTGRLVQLFGKEGEVVHVGEALVEIEIPGVEGEEAISEAEKKPETEAVEEEGAGVVGTLETAKGGAILSSSKEGIAAKEEKTEILNKKVLATPVARALAKDKGVDIKKIKGSGPAGRIMKADILNYAKSSNYEEKNPDNELEVEIENMSQIRKTIAKNMLQSKHNAAHMTSFEEVEISELDRIRKKFKDKYLSEGVKITYLPFIVKAVALALRKHKVLNAEMDMENGKMIYKKYYNIGIAVDTPKGLMVPVIRNADKISLLEIAKQIQDYAEKAKNNKISMEDMKDGSFSITNFGTIGGLFAVPVINYPQAAILGIGRVSKQPIVKNDALDIGTILPLSLSADHRVVDGADASRFINTIMEYLSDPVSLIFE
jgi:pyruvate dehydrogenase E2 component (dihydrolipoamide acetyltransferase)